MSKATGVKREKELLCKSWLEWAASKLRNFSLPLFRFQLLALFVTSQCAKEPYIYDPAEINSSHGKGGWPTGRGKRTWPRNTLISVSVGCGYIPYFLTHRWYFLDRVECGGRILSGYLSHTSTIPLPYFGHTACIRGCILHPYLSHTSGILHPYGNHTATIREPYGNRAKTIRKSLILK